MNKEFWKNKKVCVTGGAALIGRELVRQLIELNPKDLWLVDDLSSGRRENIPDDIYFFKRDLREYSQAREAIYGADVVFHLACKHGGRAYVDTHAVDCYDNLSLDTKVFRVSIDCGVEKVIFASSACVYRTDLQYDRNENLKLNEELENYHGLSNPDGAYGWAKLSAEKSLDACIKSGLIDGVSTRLFTVYGDGISDTHAIGALILKSLMKQEPFEIFGDGLQLRNWSHSKDTCRGMILAAEKMKSGYINIGTEEVNTPNSACEIIWEYLGWRPEKIDYQLDKPVGILNRVADASKAEKMLGWKPELNFRDGLIKTIEWYINNRKLPKTKEELNQRLFER